MAKITSLKLSDFRQVIHDMARPNRFEVQITPPSAFEAFDEDQLKMMAWIAETATIPSRVQGEVKMKFHGMELSLPGDYGKENLTIGFLNSYGWEGRDFFDSWMEEMQEVATTNKKLSAFDTINDCKILVNQLGRTEGEILATYEFYDVFPTSISAIDLNMGEADQIEKFTVVFSYSHWASVEVEQGKL